MFTLEQLQLKLDYLCHSMNASTKKSAHEAISHPVKYLRIVGI